MREFQNQLNYKFKNIKYLYWATCGASDVKFYAGYNNKEKKNDVLATIGDSLLSFVLADYLLNEEKCDSKGLITQLKSKLESNKLFIKLMMEENWIEYIHNGNNFYNENGKNTQQVAFSEKSCPYVEAIIAAIYYDSNSFETVKKWIIDNLLPLLEKYKY